MRTALLWGVILFVTLHNCLADIYLHCPRGTNNRLEKDEEKVKNNERLFNSQNNNHGGYNVNSVPWKLYKGSTLRIMWTCQHGTDYWVYSNISIQAYCGGCDDVTNTNHETPEDKKNCPGKKPNSDKYRNECQKERINFRFADAGNYDSKFKDIAFIVSEDLFDEQKEYINSDEYPKDVRGLNREKPDVVKAIPTLFNHNGLNIDLEYPSYEWKIPRYLSGDCCVIRIRYEIKTKDSGEYDENPTVDGVSDIKLQMTQNLNQNPRVFQDRSEVFEVEDPPRNLKRKDIYYYVGIGKEGDQVTAYTALNKRLLWPRKEIMKPGEGKAVCFVGHADTLKTSPYLRKHVFTERKVKYGDHITDPVCQT